MVISTVVVAMLAGDNLNNFLALLGAFACTPIAFTFPAWFHYRVCATTTVEKSIDITIIIVSIMLGVFSSAYTIINW